MMVGYQVVYIFLVPFYQVFFQQTFYFLDFVEENNKKNSYAASFGFEKIPDKYVNEYKHLLEKFNNISVREKQGIRIVEELLNRSAEISLDPTLLLNKTEWSKVAKEVSIKNKYVLL